jgi:glycosyltransferase involved in cell wall biosynthesis
LPTDRPILLSVGTLLELKGFHILIDALARIRRVRPDITLVIVGEGPYRPSLEKQIRKLGLQENVKLIGARPHEELSQWYSAADVFCLASSREGWANVIMEALACGCPVVATRVSGTPEILVSPSLGLLVERTPAAFELAINDALQRKWNSDTISAHARAHGWDKVASKLLRVYSEVIARS